MNKNQISYEKMVLKTVNMMEKNNDIWKDNKLIVDTMNKIGLLMKEIKKYKIMQMETSVGATAQKTKLRNELNVYTEVFCSIFRSFGVVTSNYKVQEQFAKTTTDLKMMSNISITDFVDEVIISAKERLEVLRDFGMTQAMIDELTAKFNAYKEYRSKPRLMQVKRKTATHFIKENLGKLRELISQYLDNLMMQYMITNPEFYALYKIGRDIQDPQTIHKSLMGKVTDGRNGKVMNYVLITVTYPNGKTPHKNTKHTSEKGLYQFPRLPQGKCTVTFTKPGFFALEKEVVISHTHMTRLNVQLTKDPNQPEYLQ